MRMIAVAAFAGLAAIATPAAADSMMRGHSGMSNQSYGYGYQSGPAYDQYGYGLGSVLVPGIRDARRMPSGYVYNPSTEAAVEFQESFQRDPYSDE